MSEIIPSFRIRCFTCILTIQPDVTSGSSAFSEFHAHLYRFSRRSTVPLPTAVDDTGAKASYKNGILEVRIPKSQKQVGRQIDVDFH
ncbi:Hsp20/alpha crystallin family protein [Alicyclobacillus suci]|uniref:Hsp20/alpha crystallin family protein n=1 Tax=Alicyclobacillus suci TaxID=2816080 RepID=UPI0022A7F885|nr:Hsp20/alpha crystallin family protein [Alicyclobacillus suci]